MYRFAVFKVNDFFFLSGMLDFIGFWSTENKDLYVLIYVILHRWMGEFSCHPFWYTITLGFLLMHLESSVSVYIVSWCYIESVQLGGAGFWDGWSLPGDQWQIGFHHFPHLLKRRFFRGRTRWRITILGRKRCIFLVQLHLLCLLLFCLLLGASN